MSSLVCLYLPLACHTWQCYGLNYDLPKIHMLKSQGPIPQNVAIFGDKILKETIKLK